MTDFQSNGQQPQWNTHQANTPAPGDTHSPSAETASAMLARLRLGQALHSWKNEEMSPHEALQSPVWSVRAAAVQALGQGGAHAPIERVIHALRDEHASVRATAALALKRLQPSQAITPLLEVLHTDSSWLVRAAAAQALGQLGEQVPLEAITEALHDEDVSVRSAAASALGALGQRVPLEPLLTALHDPAWQVREAAVLAVGARGQQGNPLPLAALVAASQDEDATVREAVAWLQQAYPEQCAALTASSAVVHEVLELQTRLGNLDEHAPADAFLEHGIGSQRTAAQVSASSPQQEGNLLAPIASAPRSGALRTVRLGFLLCWSLALGYLGALAWMVYQMTMMNPAGMTIHVLVEAINHSSAALFPQSMPSGVHAILTLLLCFLLLGCLWATSDVWREHQQRRRQARQRQQGDAREETPSDSLADMPGFEDTRAGTMSRAQRERGHRRVSFSRRAVLVGVMSAAVLGNGFAWYLITSRKRRQESGAHIDLGKPVVTYHGHQAGVWTVAWSPDGTRIASGGGNTALHAGSNDTAVHVWQAAHGTDILAYRGHTALVRSIAWSPDGTQMASGSEDKTVQVWHATSGVLLRRYGAHNGPVLAVAWSPNGRFIASGGQENTVHVWEVSTGKRIQVYHGHPGGMNTLAWSHDGTSILSGGNDGTVQMWEAATGKQVLTYHNASYEDQYGGAVTGALSPDGKQVASIVIDVGSSPNTTNVAARALEVWNITTQKQVNFYVGNWGFTSVSLPAWSPHGNTLACGSANKTVELWEPRTGRHLYTYHTNGEVVSVAWSPDGSQLVAGDITTGAIDVWHVPQE